MNNPPASENLFKRSLSSITDHPYLAYLVIFVVQFSVQPYFKGNQNTKFLNGASDVGYGFLANDWLGKTVDPLPAFSFIGKVIFWLHSEWLLYALFAVFLALYAHSLMTLVRMAFGDLSDRSAKLLFGALFVCFNGLLIANSDNGLSGQYLLATRYFQPCTLGVFLLWGIVEALRNHPNRAAIFFASAAMFHPTYVPHAGLLMAVMWLNHWRTNGWSRQLIYSAGLFAVILFPWVIRYLWLFRPTTDALWQESIHILTEVRIPQHTQAASWFNAQTISKIALMLAGVVFAFRTRLFPYVATLFGAMIGSMLFVMVFPIEALEFATLWRLSVILQPIAATIVIYKFCEWAAPFFADAKRQRYLRNTTVGILIIACLGGIGLTAKVFRHPYKSTEGQVINYAKETRKAGMKYLIPPRIGDFNPFRLNSGIPIVINWKSHPYLDTEVIEWYKRYQDVASYYKNPQNCDHLNALKNEYGVTHAVLVNKQEKSWSACLQGEPPLYRNKRYTVVAL
ncbi:Uncharacterised protein [BD1-7 clade bacterium]|uniref:DUF6798 domain-containing protein n=1 Tax=BD1-7 clade bacterium TaxID=2029982 RepID=A0A5S9QZH8_9GAMM|nr:Uncharacterised protein [BD1-7 clade bacterium]